MKATTLSSTQIWQSPDGEKKIWSVELKDENDKQYTLKTYSKAIAEVGFEGDVESYLDKKGERFVKQPAPAGGFGGGGNNSARLKADAEKQKEIRAEWAIGKAISSTGTFPLDAKALKEVQELAIKLNQMVDAVIAAGVES